MEAPLTQIHALWIRPGSVSPDEIPSSVTRFQEVDGPTQVLLSAGGPPAPAGWAGFALRHAHAPKLVPDLGRSPFLLAVRVVAAESDRAEFRRWLHEEHARLQVSLDGVNWFLGYEEEGAAHSFLNLWGIDAPTIVDGGAWAEIRDTPRWRRVAHVTEDADRGVYRAG